ncbi:MAG: DNA-3-methyladenine glycosylase I [Leptospirales bacterium]|nr:DNA-3-methyladenine glycosylase I [Leptospirales bacterium]
MTTKKKAAKKKAKAAARRPAPVEQRWREPAIHADGKTRCAWCGEDPDYVRYHDEEWGRPKREDRFLFEMLTLEAAQAGLSWLTILRKRENYRRAYDGFDPKKVARYTPKDVQRLLGNEGIVRNRLKILSSIDNARVFLDVQQEYGSFSRYLWSFVNDRPLQNSFRSLREIPARTELSDRLSKDLKKRGFRFVGSTICYALMQSVGLVDDHVENCWVRQEGSH